ncbi:hypothetical protein [Providencia burhodogranariea]|uniref:Uncharacterized protein n=1 Tax=Providencia burhodogranariea DSM 19968 TaxID=1141662 RepID=K8X857_9GAMM|nr:hypothetical protein [Providencia burhodogranariea]EKT64615.1 hypothetical protein OOA_02422 [Providencia burhodogranariea DSM 19968]
MFIEIDSSYKLTPQLVFKGDETGIVKKSQIKRYSDANALLIAIENRVQEYQKMIEDNTKKLIEAKQNELNEHIKQLKISAEQQITASKKKWFENADKQLKILLASQEKKLNDAVTDVKRQTEQAVRNRLIKMNQSDSLIKYLIDALHNEINDLEKSLEVVQSHSEQGTLLTIENDECIISINTQELMIELKNCIENITHV